MTNALTIRSLVGWFRLRLYPTYKHSHLTSIIGYRIAKVGGCLVRMLVGGCRVTVVRRGRQR